MKLNVKMSAGKWLISENGRQLTGENAALRSRIRKTSANVGYYFFGGKIEKLNILRKEVAADAMLHSPEFFSALGAVLLAHKTPSAKYGYSIELPSGSRISNFRRMLESASSGDSPRSMQLSLMLRFLVAAVLAIASVLMSASRYWKTRQPIVTGSVWLATYGEWTNRTRHLLSITTRTQKVVPLLVLGRPKMSLHAFEQILHKNLPGRRFKLVRPLSLKAACTALPAILADLSRALRDFRTMGHFPPLNRSWPILYRLCLGRVHGKWWRQSDRGASLVVYGHTGNADSSALELEQQGKGVKTVHLLHGISTGINFTGLSDVAIARCRHDVAWHEKLGGYGKIVSWDADRPELSEATRECGLFTNYAHPTAFANEFVGVVFEERVINIVASASRQCGLKPVNVLYRPHPARELLTLPSQRRLQQAAKLAGLSPWPFDRDLSSLSNCAIVFTTPSTIVQDALCSGTIPIVVDLVGVDPDSVYGVYPFRASSEAELVDILDEVQAARDLSFVRAWEAVGPAVLPSIKQIEALFAANS